MKLMSNWRGAEIEVAESAGGVLAVANPWDNLVRTHVHPWPPPEVIQKLYQSRQARAFREADGSGVVQALGFYSDLQSLHSEDAITWSCFGPIVYADPTVRANYVRALLQMIGVPGCQTGPANVWLWRRLPHPDKLVSGGPEIDFGVQTEDVFVLGEAKWLSGVAVGQGVSRDKDQLTLRREFCEKYGRQLLPACRHFVVLGVSRSGGIVPVIEAEADGITIYGRDITWESLTRLDVHPLAAELRAYLDWKRRNSRGG